MRGLGRILACLLACTTLSRAQEDPFAKPSERLEEAKARLAALPPPDTEESKRWREPIERRIRLLEELLRTERERADLRTIEQIGLRRDQAQRDLDTLRAAAAAQEIRLAAPEEAAAYEQRMNEAREARDKARAELEGLNSRRADADAERKGLPAREGDAKRRLEDFEKRDDEVSRYRANNARLELRVVRERNAFFEDAQPRSVALLPALELELDAAKLRYERAEKEYKLAAAEAARLRDAEAQRMREQAEAERRAAERERDPVERFRRNAAADAGDARSELDRLRGRPKIIEGAAQERKESAESVRSQRQNLERRLELRDEGTADLLRRVRERTRRSRQILERTTLPEINAEMEQNQIALAQVMDRLWSLQTPLDENDELQTLLDSLPPERHEEATAVFREASRDLIEALRAKRAALERVETALGSLTEHVLQLDKELEALQLFVEDRILWIQSDAPMSSEFFAAAAREMLTITAPYRRASVWRQIAGLRSVLLAAAGAAVVMVFFLATRMRRRAQAMAEAADGKSAILRFLAGLVSAALPPAGVYGAALAVRALDLPEVVGSPLSAALALLAVIGLVRRLAGWLLGTAGPAVQALGMPADVAALLLRSVRAITIAAALLRVPSALLEKEPFALSAIPALLEGIWFTLLVLALVALVRPRGALVQQLTRPDGWARRAFGLIYALTAANVLVALAAHALGYRQGARFLWENAFYTVLAIIVIATLYSGLVRVIGKIAARVRSRTMKAEGAAAAWQMSATVVDQLTRLLATLVTVVAILLFLEFWGLSGKITRALENVHIFRLGEQEGEVDYLSLWNVVCALFWIAGGHFVVRNLSALYDSLISPVLQKTDAAGRYVFLALSRYAILLVAYGAALLTLRLSLSSIGWLLAAVSFGVGFGLQEIVANFVSGLIILLERPIRVGDLIEVGTTVATVEKIDIRATTVVNPDRQIIVLPNKEIITKNLTNWTRNDRLMRRKVCVGVAYGSDVEMVLRVLDEEARAHPKVLADPPPVIRFARFGDSSLDFEVYFFSKVEDGWPAIADLNRQINARFAKEGIEIPFPQRDLHIRSGWEALETLAAARRAAESAPKGGGSGTATRSTPPDE